MSEESKYQFADERLKVHCVVWHCSVNLHAGLVEWFTWVKNRWRMSLSLVAATKSWIGRPIYKTKEEGRGESNVSI